MILRNSRDAQDNTAHGMELGQKSSLGNCLRVRQPLACAPRNRTPHLSTFPYCPKLNFICLSHEWLDLRTLADILIAVSQSMSRIGEHPKGL